MKKKIFIAGLSAVLAACLVGCPEPSTVGAGNLTDYLRTETLAEWYVERYDDASPNDDPLEARYYNADGTLKEYLVFQYTGGLNTDVLVYNSDTILDATTLIGQYTYGYTGVNCTSGTCRRLEGGSLQIQSTFTAWYNAQNNYLECLEQDDLGNVIEHRVCTYDASGENYLTETYYSGADIDPADIVERYACTYDPVVTWRWIREDHFLTLTDDGSGNGFPVYTSYKVHTFTWIGNSETHYLQTDFESDNTYAYTGNNMISTIMYTFNDDLGYYPRTRSYYNQNGRLMLHRTYQYDAGNNLIELCWYNYANTQGNELDSRKAYRLYTQSLNTMYEEKTYTYSYAARAAAGPETLRNKFKTPGTAHHKNDL